MVMEETVRWVYPLLRHHIIFLGGWSILKAAVVMMILVVFAYLLAYDGGYGHYSVACRLHFQYSGTDVHPIYSASYLMSSMSGAHFMSYPRHQKPK